MRTGLTRLSCLAVLAGLWLFSLGFAAGGAEKVSPTETPPKVEDSTDAQQTLRSYLQLQEQLHNTLLTIERARKDSEAAAKANADAIALRLEAIERSLGAQQTHQADLLQNSNRVTLIAAGTFAALGLLAMVLTAWFLLRSLNRLTPMGSAVGPAHMSPILSPDPHLMDPHPVAASSGRLLGVIDRLEQRIEELEQTSHFPLPTDAGSRHNGSNTNSEVTAYSGGSAGPKTAGPTEGAPTPVAPSVGVAEDRNAHPPTAEAAPGPSAAPDRISVILGKGQSLLSLDKIEEAIACFDEALALEPGHAEVLVKKGTALERLKRLEEAIGCYDRAIAADPSMTLAYLYKGGACNQLERFSEALECYEKALRTQQKNSPAEA